MGNMGVVGGKKAKEQGRALRTLRPAVKML